MSKAMLNSKRGKRNIDQFAHWRLDVCWNQCLTVHLITTSAALPLWEAEFSRWADANVVVYKGFMSSNRENNNYNSCSKIVKVQKNGGTYSSEIPLFGEVEMQQTDSSSFARGLPENDPPHGFRKKLLREVAPKWKHDMPSSSRGSRRKVRLGEQVCETEGHRIHLTPEPNLRKKCKLHVQVFLSEKVMAPKIDPTDPLFRGALDVFGAALIPINCVSWLMSSASAELLSCIVYSISAFEVWEYLKERFDKVNRMRLYQLHREINNLHQGTDSVSAYFTKLKTLWSEYDAVIPVLSGLNESYDQAKKQILMKELTPTLNQAYTMIEKDEIQQLTCNAVTSDKTDPIAMQVNRNFAETNHSGQGYKEKRTGTPYKASTRSAGNRVELLELTIVNCQFKAHRDAGGNIVPSFPLKHGICNRSSEKRWNIVNTIGRKNGMPYKASPRHAGNRSELLELTIVNLRLIATRWPESKDINNTVVAKAQGFLDEEYIQIMALLNKDAYDSKQVNMSEKEMVNPPTGAKVDISHIGETQILNDETPRDVLFVPEFKLNLLTFHTSKLEGIGKEKGGLYILMKVYGLNKEHGRSSQRLLVAEVDMLDATYDIRGLGKFFSSFAIT
ncbi:hypothetical protein FXO37_03110 [Capsicum annuum]|nr:hypothetical protein FXO37_03110 [Capsicum annuum]